MKIELRPAIAENYEIAQEVPFNPAFIGNRVIDFTKLSESDAAYLISIESPYIVRKVKTKTKNKIIVPASQEVKKEE